MQNIEFIQPESQHVPELARICFEAFKSIHDRHAFPRDFADVETAANLLGLLTTKPEVIGVAARLDGRLVGSNFALLGDGVGGIGPITVDPAWHGRSIGRGLMEKLLELAAKRGVANTRLVQDSFNTASLSLYASLGFDVREPLALLQAPIATKADGTVRVAREEDLPALEELGRRLTRLSRRNELTSWSQYGFPTVVREVAGTIRGYLIPGKIGHGAAETDEDALALVGQLTHFVPPVLAQCLCPMRRTSLFRAAIGAGARTVKVMNYMSRGDYEPPVGVWFPSFFF